MSLKIVTGVLNVSKNELNLRACLRGGMSFRWTKTSEDDDEAQQFIGVLKSKIYVLNQIETKKVIEYEAHVSSSKKIPTEEEIKNELIDYFRLDTDLTKLYNEWSELDSTFKKRVENYPDVLNGIRVLRQEPVENLFSFICSSNNHIRRITTMVNNLCIHYGSKIGSLNGTDYFAFPTINQLVQPGIESKLKSLSFGYRGKFITKAAEYLKENHSEEWLYSLRDKSYSEAHQDLTKIYGIGNKVADCICLMSMDKLEAIPVDTHVLNIARKHYKFPHKKNPKSKSNNLSDKMYKDIGNMFREMWGDCAGWAQTVMFIDDLKGEFLQQKTESLKKSNSLSDIKLEPKTESTIKTEPSEHALKKEPIIKTEPDIKTELNEAGDQIDSKENLTHVKVEPVLVDKKIKRTNEKMVASPAAKSKINKKKRRC